MLGRKQFIHRGHVPRSSRSRASVHAAASLAFCEALEPRRLLTQFTFNVPQNDGYTAVYLQAHQNDGWVNVLKNSATGTIVHTFSGESNNGTGMYIVDSGDIEDFLFVDQVSAKDKPRATTQDPDDHGILVRADSGSDAALLIDRRGFSRDQYIWVSESSSTSTTVRVWNNENDDLLFGYTRLEGVTNLTLRTNDNAATDYFPFFGGGTDVVVQNLVADIFLTVDTGAGTYDRIWLGTNESLENGRVLEEANVITGAGRCIVYVRGESGAGNTTRARIDFGPGSQTGHNRLEVLVNGVATLAQLAGANHTVVVEEVHVQSGYSDKPAVLFVEDPSQIDDLDEIEQAQATVEPTADGTEVGSWLVNPSCTASIQGESTIGDFTIEGDVEFIGIISNPPTVKHSTVNNFEVGASSVASSSGQVRVNIHADVTALDSSSIGALNIMMDGLFTLQQRPQPPEPGNGRVLSVKSLFIEKDPSEPMGILDLKDNAMIVDYPPGDSPLDDIRQYIKHAYNGGAWDADGITTSVGDSSTHALGYAENDGNSSTTGGVGYTSFAGRAVDDSSVLVRYTF